MENRRGKSGSHDRLYSLGSKITVDGNFSHELKIHLLLGSKALTNLDSVLENRDHFASKGPYIKAMVFPVVMYRCEN